MEAARFTCALLLICSLILEGVSAVLEHNDIRLVNNPDGELCEGRLEIYQSTEFVRAWFAVCDRSFGEEELMVTCRQLGCPYNAPSKTDVSRYGKRSGYMMAFRRDCSGHESGFSVCYESNSHACNYRESDLVAVKCNKGHRVQVWMTLTVILSIITLILFS